MTPLEPVVVKLGGDALASPARIAAEARRLVLLAEKEPVVAVTSARRGVTDHLLGLVDSVRAEIGAHPRAHAEADRAVAAGEVVTASLLALALNELGVEAVSLDAREAGVIASGRPGSTTIRTVIPRRLERLLARGAIPVVTGFQGWRRGRVATLGRGGTDTSAVALGVAIGATRGIFVKDTEGLRTADPRLVPDSRPIRMAPHAFLTALAVAGARVIHPEAARLAEANGLTLEFCTIHDPTPLSTVRGDAEPDCLRAVATLVSASGAAQVTAIAGNPIEAAAAADMLREVLLARGIEPGPAGPRFIVAASLAEAATRTIHETFVGAGDDLSRRTRRAS